MAGRRASLIFRACLALAVCAGGGSSFAVEGLASLLYGPRAAAPVAESPPAASSPNWTESDFAFPSVNDGAGQTDDAQAADDGTRLTSTSGAMPAGRTAKASQPMLDAPQWEDSPPPPSMVENFPGAMSAEADGAGAPHWANPYEATIADPYLGPPSRLGLRRFLPPPGILPYWGPRTNDADRFVGWGQPLYGTSWLNRPLGASWFIGFMEGGNPIPGVVGQHGGVFGGYRFTWDYDYYYGLDARLGMAAIALQYPQINRPTATSDLYVADISVVYYPLGDSRYRPFVSLGIGTTKISFYDYHDNYYGGVLTSMPFGVGLKYRWREWVSFRGDITDNLAFGRGPFATMHNVSYTAGFEVRFGGTRRTYYDYQPSKQMW